MVAVGDFGRAINWLRPESLTTLARGQPSKTLAQLHSSLPAAIFVSSSSSSGAASESPPRLASFGYELGHDIIVVVVAAGKAPQELLCIVVVGEPGGQKESTGRPNEQPFVKKEEDRSGKLLGRFLFAAAAACEPQLVCLARRQTRLGRCLANNGCRAGPPTAGGA